MNHLCLALLLSCAVSAYGDVVQAAVQSAVKQTEHIDLSVPAYTESLRNIDLAIATVKSHLSRQEVADPNDTYVQYVMIVNAINQLIDASVNDSYEEIYYNIVFSAILETVTNPQESADKVRAQLDKTSSKISVIRDLINKKQETECQETISYTCDIIIDIAVKTSNDELLKKQANLIQTVATEADMFLSDYSTNFEQTAASRGAQALLVNGISGLKPLVMAGREVRIESSVIPPLTFRRFGASVFRVASYPF